MEITDANLYAARDLWLSNQTAALAIYGHISDWDTSAVTSMDFLFCGDRFSNVLCNDAASIFNANLSAWNTTSVTSMRGERIGCRSPTWLTQMLRS